MRDFETQADPRNVSLGTLRDRANQVRGIPLESVLRLSGAQPDRYDQRKWHTAQGVISVTGAKFMNWNCGRGGGGAIDLVIHLHHLGFAQAVQWLGQSFPDTFPPEPNRLFPKATLAIPRARAFPTLARPAFHSYMCCLTTLRPCPMQPM